MKLSLSKYNFFQQANEHVLVYNAASGNCIVLSESDFQLFRKMKCSEIDSERYLFLDFYIHDDDDEIQHLLSRCNQCKKHHRKRKYRILTTTFCNASCPYCYEIGVKSIAMSCETAQAVADFILTQSINASEIEIEWFGGEPLLNVSVIDLICKEILCKKPEQTFFKSSIITNGFLISKDMVDKMVTDWKVYKIQITLDGFAHEYERVKGLGVGSFEQVIKNIGLVCSHRIKTNIRLNFDSSNLNEMRKLIQYLATLPFKDQIRVYAARINHGGEIDLSSLEKETKEMYNLLHDYGFMTRLQLLPRTMKTPCSVSFPGYYMINADGKLFKCDRKLLESNSIGNILTQTIDLNRCSSEWENLPLSQKCCDCKLLPLCWGGCTYERKTGQTSCHITEDIVYNSLRLVLSDYLHFLSCKHV